MLRGRNGAFKIEWSLDVYNSGPRGNGVNVIYKRVILVISKFSVFFRHSHLLVENSLRYGLFFSDYYEIYSNLCQYEETTSSVLNL